MIISLPDTSTSQIARKLVTMREGTGQQTTGRVLTLIIIATVSDDVESMIAAASSASREHPSRVLILLTDDNGAIAAGTDSGPAAENDASSIDAEIRIGGHAGASEIVILRLSGPVAQQLLSVVTPLLLPDTPIVAWWPCCAPNDVSADPIGAIAQRRITDTLMSTQDGSLFSRRHNYTPGDSDLAWARLTTWRGVVASTLDQPPHNKITGAVVVGPPQSPSVDLAAGWLADRCGTTVQRLIVGEQQTREQCAENPTAISRAVLERGDSTITITIVDSHTIRVEHSETGTLSLVALTHRSLADCLAEELRHLEPDDAYGRALRGLGRVEFFTA